MPAAKSASSSSTSTMTSSSGRSAGVGRGRTCSFDMGPPFPAARLGNREPEARGFRPARSSRRRPRCAVRRRRRTDRRIRALLVVHGGDRHVRRWGGYRPGGGPSRGGGARPGATARDGLPRRAARRRRRSTALLAPLRGAGLRRVRARLVKARLHTDGGARGNPGPAAYGVVLEAEDGRVLASEKQTIGTATNNVAEYSGLIAGLQKALELHVKRGDNELADRLVNAALDSG